MRGAHRLQCDCGARYADLRTGLTFGAVVRLMMTGTPETYRQLRRHGVLGYWHELKLQLWESIHGACSEAGQVRPIRLEKEAEQAGDWHDQTEDIPSA